MKSGSNQVVMADHYQKNSHYLGNVLLMLQTGEHEHFPRTHLMCFGRLGTQFVNDLSLIIGEGVK
jgi:hypothetical protein